jgi:hypothetical protein
MSLVAILIVLAAGIVVLALLTKESVKASLKMPGLAFGLEAKDRRAAPQKRLAPPKPRNHSNEVER